MPAEPQHAELLAHVAHLYFEKGDDQNAIARRLHVSRSSVSRLLTQARRRGIVEIRIHYPLTLDREQGAALCARFPLKEAFVVRVSRGDALDAKTQVARYAAHYLEQHLASDTVVAISRGSTLHEMVQHVTASPHPEVRVVQLVGTLRISNPLQDDANLAQALAQKVHGEYYNLTAPLFVENVETRRALFQEPAIREVLDLAGSADLALVGIGSLDRKSSAIMRQKLLAPAQMDQLRKSNAVGEICSQYFDDDGTIVSPGLSERTVSLELERLRAIPRVVGVATGVHKARAIRGALRGGYVSVIMTDDQTATRVLDLERAREPSLKTKKSH